MENIYAPRRAPEDRTRRPNPRPDRFALWAVVLAVVAMLAGVATADGASGGISAGGDDTTTTRKAAKEQRYASIYDNFARRAKRWARKTGACESGNDPKAVSPGGTYRGAFQFMRSTWRTSPKSPGGDPIRYRWKTQAVVAVKLKRRDGAGHWPNCG